MEDMDSTLCQWFLLQQPNALRHNRLILRLRLRLRLLCPRVKRSKGQGSSKEKKAQHHQKADGKPKATEPKCITDRVCLGAWDLVPKAMVLSLASLHP